MSHKFALIIGTSEYDDKNFACLKTPAADVLALAEVLLDATRGGFDEAHTLINESDSTIRKAIERFFARKKSDDLLLLYFSGHGVMDDQGRLYLAAKDTESEILSASAIPATFITDNMDRSQSRRQVLILDCCHSGAFFRGTKSVTGAKAVTKTTFEGKGYGKVVLTATDSTQYAWSDDQVIGKTETSVFTHFLIEGLKTGAADTNNSGQITLDELYEYVYRNLVSATSKQTPRKWAYNQEGELVIAQNPSPVIAPAPLPDELLEVMEHPNSLMREGAIRELEQLLGGRNKGLALSARKALEHIAVDDDSSRLKNFASEILERHTMVTPPTITPEPQFETVTQEDLKAAEKQVERQKERAKKEKEKQEEEKRLEIAALNIGADAAIAIKDWSMAVENLQALLVLDPDHTQAAAKLKGALKEIEKERKEAERRQKIADLEREVEAEESREGQKPVPPPMPTDPTPTELTTPHSLKPAQQPDLFTDYTLPVEQTRKLWPLAVAAGFGLAIVIGIVAFISSSNKSSPPAGTQFSSDTASKTNVPTQTPSPTPETVPTPNKVAFENFLTSFIRKDRDMAQVVESYKTTELGTLRRVVYGDLDGDGDEDAAVWYCGHNMGLGQQYWCKLVAFTNINGVLTDLASRTWDLNRWESSLLESLTPDGKIIIGNEAQEVGDGGSPRVKSQTKIVLDGNKLKEV